MRQDIDYVVSVLAEAVGRRQSPQQRFERAVELRRQMHEAINSGALPRGTYRYEWLKERATALLKLLDEWGVAFDQRYPDDTATLLDLYDITSTARTVLSQKLKSVGLDPSPSQPATPAPTEPQQ